MKLLPYGLPALIILLFVASVYIQFFWVGPILIPLVTIFNPFIGSFNTSELISEYYFFHHDIRMAYWKRVNGFLFIAFNAWFLWFLFSSQLSFWELILFIYSVVIISINLSISLAHDLMHSEAAIDRFLARVLLVCNGFFYLETDHLYIHHRYVGTLNDPASARFNEGLYAYLLRSVPQRMKLIFSGNLDLDEQKKKTIRSGLILQCGICAAGLVLSWFAGMQVFVCVLSQFIFVPLIYEVITYIQHYALSRTMDRSGKPVDVQLDHSWNCYYKISAYLHFMVAVHSIHHLRNEPEKSSLSSAGPRYPKPFTKMVVLALFPGYWFRLMNPEVKSVSLNMVQV